MQLTREIWGWLAPSVFGLEKVSQRVRIFQSSPFWSSVLNTFILLCFHEIFHQKFDLLTREIWVWLAPSVSGLKTPNLFAFSSQILFEVVFLLFLSSFVFTYKIFLNYYFYPSLFSQDIFEFYATIKSWGSKKREPEGCHAPARCWEHLNFCAFLELLRKSKQKFKSCWEKSRSCWEK